MPIKCWRLHLKVWRASRLPWSQEDWVEWPTSLNVSSRWGQLPDKRGIICGYGWETWPQHELPKPPHEGMSSRREEPSDLRKVQENLKLLLQTLSVATEVPGQVRWNQFRADTDTRARLHGKRLWGQPLPGGAVLRCKYWQAIAETLGNLWNLVWHGPDYLSKRVYGNT